MINHLLIARAEIKGFADLPQDFGPEFGHKMGTCHIHEGMIICSNVA